MPMARGTRAPTRTLPTSMSSAGPMSVANESGKTMPAAVRAASSHFN